MLLNVVVTHRCSTQSTNSVSFSRSIYKLKLFFLFCFQMFAKYFVFLELQWLMTWAEFIPRNMISEFGLRCDRPAKGVEHRWARLVMRWVTTKEHQCLFIAIFAEMYSGCWIIILNSQYCITRKTVNVKLRRVNSFLRHVTTWLHNFTRFHQQTEGGSP
jgi:hypothetical protein